MNLSDRTLKSVDAWLLSDYYQKYKSTGLSVRSTPNYDQIVTDIWHYLEELTGDKSMPTRFIVVLMTYSNSNIISTALQEWSLTNVVESWPQCICSHDIVHNFPIYNTVNQNILVTGSDCIEKFSFNADLKATVSQIVKNRKTSSTKRQCVSCGKHNIASDKPDYVKQCKSCYSTKAPITIMRLCSKCNNYNITPDKPLSYTRCLNCFNDKQANRPCNNCKQWNIPLSRPAYMKLCYDCYTKD